MLSCVFWNLNELRFEYYNSYLYVQIKTYNSLNFQPQLVIFLTANCSNPIVFFKERRLIEDRKQRTRKTKLIKENYEMKSKVEINEKKLKETK